jgi:hypothetical protein
MVLICAILKIILLKIVFLKLHVHLVKHVKNYFFYLLNVWIIIILAYNCGFMNKLPIKTFVYNSKLTNIVYKPQF